MTLAQNRHMSSRQTPPDLPTRAEVLAALSVAIDLGLGQPAEHMLRSALIATRIADRLGLAASQRDCIYYSTLIMWIGCHADSHEYARWFGDDIAVRRGSYLVDWSGLPYQRFLLTNIGRGESLLSRLKTAATLYANARGHISQLIHSHCTSAALLAERIGLSDDVQTALRFTFERFDGGGLPTGASGEAIPIEMRVAQLADMVEVHQREYGTEGAVAMARSRRGGQFDPAVVDAFVADPSGVLAVPSAGDVWATALQHAPDRHTRLDGPSLDALLGGARRLRRPQMPLHPGAFAGRRPAGGRCRRHRRAGRGCRHVDPPGGMRARHRPHRGVEPDLVQVKRFDDGGVRADAAAPVSVRAHPVAGLGPEGRRGRRRPIITNAWTAPGTRAGWRRAS